MEGGSSSAINTLIYQLERGVEETNGLVMEKKGEEQNEEQKRLERQRANDRERKARSRAKMTEAKKNEE